MSLRSIICSLCAITIVTLAGSSAALAQQPRPATPAAPAAPRPGAPATPPSAGPTAGLPVLAAPPGTPPVMKPDAGYIIGVDDVVEAEVVGRSDFRVRAKVGADGNIPMPYVGAVNAKGKTSLQLAEEIRGLLEKAGIYRSPIMRVEVVGFASRYVTVLGSVATPGLVPVDRPYRLSEIMARVGGVRAGGADYVVLTPEQGEARQVSMKTLATGDRASDPYVAPGDKIFAPEAELFYVSGQVRSPGAFPISEGMTVRTAIARAGGLTDIGSEKGIKVTHPTGKVEKPGMNGKIMPGDVINVGERLF